MLESSLVLREISLKKGLVWSGIERECPLQPVKRPRNLLKDR